MSLIVLPGDEYPIPTYERGSCRHAKTVGCSLDINSSKMMVVKSAGVLKETDKNVWIESAETRYIPKSGDMVLGTVTTHIGDYYRVDVGGPQQALLNFLSFEGATKRNRPNIKPGNLVYGQIFLASKNIEPELTCVDNDARSVGMGLLRSSGVLFHIPLSHARKLLRPDCSLIQELGKTLKFEIVIGMNGHIYVAGPPRTVATVQKVIRQSIGIFDSNYIELINSVLSEALT